MSSTNTWPNSGVNSISVTTWLNLAKGRINQVAIEEAQDDPMNGTLVIKSYSIMTIP
jgi:hypothetical protein